MTHTLGGTWHIALITDLIAIELTTMYCWGVCCRRISVIFSVTSHRCDRCVRVSTKIYFYCFASTQLEPRELKFYILEKEWDVSMYRCIIISYKHARVYNEALCCLSFLTSSALTRCHRDDPCLLNFIYKNFMAPLKNKNNSKIIDPPPRNWLCLISDYCKCFYFMITLAIKNYSHRFVSHQQKRPLSSCLLNDEI